MHEVVRFLARTRQPKDQQLSRLAATTSIFTISPALSSMPTLLLQPLLLSCFSLAILLFQSHDATSMSSSSTTTMKSALPRRTFYRRPLPPSCTALSSPQGRQQFESALRHRGCKSYFVLAEQFTTQSEPAYCGITSLVMVLNALAVDPRQLWKGNWRWYHEELLNCCVDLEEIKVSGITLNIFACLARCQGLKVEKIFAQDSTVDEFRRNVELACVENDSVNDNTDSPLLVVSYDRGVLKQTGTGHFSPIAAYDPPSDQVLILDTARFKYGPHWVPLPLIFDAMLPVDPDTGKSRGYTLLSHINDDAASIMPISILLRSSQAQNPARVRYKHFLANHDFDVQWDQVLDFWSNGGKDSTHIWSMMEPQLSPTEKDAADAVIAVHTLLKSMVPQTQQSSSSSQCLPNNHECKPCRVNFNRSVQLTPEEAIYIVYLASLSIDRREELVYSAAGPANVTASDHESRQQLLMEADLVRYAIDNSDEMEEEAKRMGLHQDTSNGEMN